MKARHDIKGRIKICAFCKYWYDPTNAAISPVNPRSGLWEYDREAKCPCLKQANARNLRPSYAQGCDKYECKISD